MVVGGLLNRPNSVGLPLPLAYSSHIYRSGQQALDTQNFLLSGSSSSALGSISRSQHLECHYHPLRHGDCPSWHLWTGCFEYPLCSREDSEVEVRFSGVQGSNLPTSTETQYFKILRASRGTPASLVHRLELSKNSFLYAFLSLAIRGLGN